MSKKKTDKNIQTFSPRFAQYLFTSILDPTTYFHWGGLEYGGYYETLYGIALTSHPGILKKVAQWRSKYNITEFVKYCPASYTGYFLYGPIPNYDQYLKEKRPEERERFKNDPIVFQILKIEEVMGRSSLTKLIEEVRWFLKIIKMDPSQWADSLTCYVTCNILPLPYDPLFGFHPNTSHPIPEEQAHISLKNFVIKNNKIEVLFPYIVLKKRVSTKKLTEYIARNIEILDFLVKDLDPLHFEKVNIIEFSVSCFGIRMQFLDNRFTDDDCAKKIQDIQEYIEDNYFPDKIPQQVDNLIQMMQRSQYINPTDSPEDISRFKTWLSKRLNELYSQSQRKFLRGIGKSDITRMKKITLKYLQKLYPLPGK